jgi:FkbM family methyltransferase
MALSKYIRVKLNSFAVRFILIINHFSLNFQQYKVIKLAMSPASPKLHFLAYIQPTKKNILINLVEKSNSQMFQDLFVINELNYQNSGFYVEFGALDGIKHSNTLLLEKTFNWTGILAEPSRKSFSKLSENRNFNILDARAVYSVSGQSLLFNETFISGLSTLEEFSKSDDGIIIEDRYLVETVSLTDLLIEKRAPRRINYLSLDTEGSEFEILKEFDFGLFEIDIITCEHNFTQERDKIRELLLLHGFQRKYEKLSSIDDYYVHSRVQKINYEK